MPSNKMASGTPHEELMPCSGSSSAQWNSSKPSRRVKCSMSCQLRRPPYQNTVLYPRRFIVMPMPKGDAARFPMR